MNNQEEVPGGPSPDYPIETQHQVVTSASGETAGSNSSRSLGKAPGNTDRSSPEGVDVVPEHSVVERRQNVASAQSTGNTLSDPSQLAQDSDDLEGKRSPAPGSQLETSGGATAAVGADPKPILLVQSANEDSGHLSRGPSDAARSHPENLSATHEAPAGEGAQRSASLVSRRTNRSLATDGSAFANGAATTKKKLPDVDPSLQARAASAEGELSPRDKAVISKEESASSFCTSKGRM
jgi:hypothetical protein